jgi:deazaflavin-dependent oxidoreductase (nitroreductase family)
MAVLEVRGRASGQRRSTPVVIATVEGNRYLVSMLGSGSDWVKNVEAAHGDAVLRQGRQRSVHLVGMPPAERAHILREYVRVATSGRHHFPVAVGAPLFEFRATAERYLLTGQERPMYAYLKILQTHLETMGGMMGTMQDMMMQMPGMPKR